MNDNDNKITEELEEIIEVVDAPKEAKKTDKVSRVIKLASSTFRKTTGWFRKKLNKIQISITEKRIEKAEDNLANKEFQRVNEERAKVEKTIYRKALKYEKLKDKLDLLVAKGYNRIPEKVDIPAKKRAINLKNAMFKALKYNGSGWVLDPEKRKDVFSVNYKSNESETSRRQENEENVINFGNIDQELKQFKEEQMENNSINQGNIYRYTKNDIIQDMPINSVKTQIFNTKGMSDEKIAESINKIGEYHPYVDITKTSNDDTVVVTEEEIENSINQTDEYNPNFVLVEDSKVDTPAMSDEEKENPVNKIMELIAGYKANNNDEKTEENNSISDASEEQETTEIKENGTKVVTSADGKSRMFDFTNTDRTYMDGTTRVTISNNGKSRLYEFNTNTSEKENDNKIDTESKENQDEQKLDLNINELKNFRSQLAQLSEQRKAAEAAKQKAAEERMAAEQAVQDARLKAQHAKESYIEKINREQAEIDAINSDINNMTSDIQKNQQAAKMANEYALAIEQMISGDESINEEKRSSK